MRAPPSASAAASGKLWLVQPPSGADPARSSWVVAIDGPSGAGKSTVARRVAATLGARYLDTGAMYRAITWIALQSDVDLTDNAALTRIARAAQLEVGTDPDAPTIAVGEHRIDDEIRSDAVTAAVSAVSAVPAVREHLVSLQRRLIDSGAIVVEGRDIGTVVVPNSAVKVFLTASSAARATRRTAERGRVRPADVAETEADLSRRDNLDSSRGASPLTQAPDAVVIDTTGLAVDDVVARVLALVRARIPELSTAPPSGSSLP